MNPDLEKKPFFVNPVFIAYVMSNLIGLLIYFVADISISNLARSEQRDYYDGVDGITYFCTALPVLGLFVLVNLAWGIKSLIDLTARNDARALIAVLVVSVLWFGVYGLCNCIGRLAIQHGTNHYPG